MLSQCSITMETAPPSQTAEEPQQDALLPSLMAPSPLTTESMQEIVAQGLAMGSDVVKSRREAKSEMKKEEIFTKVKAKQSQLSF